MKTKQKHTEVTKVLEQWKGRGIQVQYFVPQKHGGGGLYLQLASVNDEMETMNQHGNF